MLIITDVPDRDIVARNQNLEEQRQGHLKRLIQEMIETEHDWVEKEIPGFKAESLFLRWKIMNPLVMDPRVFRTIEPGMFVLIPLPEFGTTVFEYVKKDKKTSIVYTLPQKVAIEAGLHKVLEMDEISQKSLEMFASGALRNMVVRRNREIYNKNKTAIERAKKANVNKQPAKLGRRI